MPQTPSDVIRAWFDEVWNKGDESSIDRHLSADAIVHGMDEARTSARGPDGFRPFFHKIRAAFSDIHFELHTVIEDGSVVAARWTASLTHTGDALGAPATGRPIIVTGMSFGRVENGRLVEAWNEWDRMGMLIGIGAMAMPG